MGMLVSVYRHYQNGHDCTNGGISSNHSMLCLTNVEGPFEPKADAPAAVLVMTRNGVVVVRPEAEHNAGKWLMMGGNYAATSDSRFTEAVEELYGYRFYGAVPIHDRME